MKLLRYFIVIFLFVSANDFATEIFKCAQSDGSYTFSDKACPKGVEAEKVTYKDRPWTSFLESSKPQDLIITNIKAAEGDTFISFNFTNQSSATQFMRLAHDLSKQNVHLLKMKAPIKEKQGEATIQVTTKEFNLQKDNSFFKTSASKTPPK